MNDLPLSLRQLVETVERRNDPRSPPHFVIRDRLARRRRRGRAQALGVGFGLGLIVSAVILNIIMP
jgi:hypothetical protein